MPDLLFSPLADIDEAEIENLEIYNLTTPLDEMKELELKLRALLDEANAAGAFASVGSAPVKDGTKLEFYFTLRVSSNQPTKK